MGELTSRCELTSRKWQVIASVIFVAAVITPILWSGFAALSSHWHPAGDWAVLELKTRDVGTAVTPLVGPYSRYGWNHPGPLLFWVLALPYRLSGGSSSSLLLSAAVVNAIAVAGIGLFAWRRGRVVLVAITMSALALLIFNLGPSLLRDPWNPSVTILPLGCFVIAAWSTAEGDRLALPVMAVIGSFLVQSHVGYVPIVAALGLAGFVRFIRVAEWKRPGIITTALLAVVWVPVLIDQFVGTGNLGNLISYFTTASHPTAGGRESFGVLSREIGGIAPWLGGHEPVSMTDGHLLGAPASRLVFLIAAFSITFALAIHHQAKSAVRFQVTTAIAVLVTMFSVARITPPVFDYIVRWTWVIGMLLWVSIAWSAWSVVTLSRSMDHRRATSAATITLLACCVAIVGWGTLKTVSHVDDVGTPDGDWWVQLDPIVEYAVNGTRSSVSEGSSVLVRALGGENGSIADGIRLQLERAGFKILVDSEHAHIYGRSRDASRKVPEATLFVVTGPMVDDMAPLESLTRLAHWDPMTIQERSTQKEEMAELGNELRATGRDDLAGNIGTGDSLEEARGMAGIDQELLERVEQGRRRGDQVAVYLVNDRP